MISSKQLNEVTTSWCNEEMRELDWVVLLPDDQGEILSIPKSLNSAEWCWVIIVPTSCSKVPQSLHRGRTCTTGGREGLLCDSEHPASCNQMWAPLWSSGSGWTCSVDVPWLPRNICVWMRMGRTTQGLNSHWTSMTVSKIVLIRLLLILLVAW